MTSSKIGQMAAMLNSSELLCTQKQSGESEIAFGAFLNQTSGGENQNQFSCENAEKTIRVDTANQTAYVMESSKNGYRENVISRNEASDTQDKLPEDTSEKLKAFEKQVKETVAEKLGISEEEVTQQMEAMGLNVMDLMDPSKLAGLVMELTGSEDIGGLLLSEDFQQLIGQIQELSQELTLQLNLTPEEMNQVMEQLEDIVSEMPQEQLPQNTEELTAEQTRDAAVTDVVSDEKEPAEIAQPVVQSSDEKVDEAQVDPTETTETEENQQKVTVEAQETSTETEQEDTQEGKTGQESELSQEVQGEEKTQNRQTHVTYQTTTQVLNQGQTVETTQTVVQTRVNVDDILHQVSQMTRVIVGQTESSVEMQLNPANLGKVYLQVVSREGVITAQLAAQNEAVKEALESQISVLKENMNQQGMKVEAIEVTIASHEFERNLEENQQNAAREQQEAETRKNGRRNLNLNSLDELEGLMSEEESLVAKMMSEQGNSVDMTA